MNRLIRIVEQFLAHQLADHRLASLRGKRVPTDDRTDLALGEGLQWFRVPGGCDGSGLVDDGPGEFIHGIGCQLPHQV